MGSVTFDQFGSKTDARVIDQTGQSVLYVFVGLSFMDIELELVIESPDVDIKGVSVFRQSHRCIAV